MKTELTPREWLAVVELKVAEIKRLEADKAELLEALEAVDAFMEEVVEVVNFDKFNRIWLQVSNAIAKVKGQA